MNRPKFLKWLFKLYLDFILSYRDGQTKTVCYMRWPDGHYPKSTSEHV